MAMAYLWFNAALYIGLAVWSTAAPDQVARIVGLAFASPSGRSEFITVYGGLEFGVGLFFLAAALKPELRHAGLLFGLLFYAGLACWRLPTLLVLRDIARPTYILAATEAALFAASIALWLAQRRAA